MQNLWNNALFFKESYISIGWNLSTEKYFPRENYLSADTETKLYLNEKLLTEQEAYNLYKDNGAKWCRENITCKAYAFMLSNGKDFALFQNAEDFLTACAMFRVKKVFWYNARFDFAIFDYYFATNDWKKETEVDNNNKKYGDKIYSALNGDFGQRYQLKIHKGYKNNSRHDSVHMFKMLDICNIFAGGLKKNLIDWKIQDDEGKDVRKLEMDYVNGSIEEDLDYMIADTKGLHLLAEKINEAVLEISGFSLFSGDYMTAGGLAKKSLLKFMYKQDKPKENLKLFQADFPMTINDDKFFRENKLYQGGKCFVNPFKVGKIQYNIYKYDVNSMYPAQMKKMKYPYGNYKDVMETTNDENKVYVFYIKNIRGKIKENMVPVWYDTIDGEYKSEIYEPELRLIWEEELDELENWYDLTFDIVRILEYEAKECEGAKEYIDNYYKIKKENKGSIRNGAKLFLNSAYGKLAQRINRIECQYELSEEGYIHLVKLKETVDGENIMSVLVGSRVTALARVCLMEYIRLICKNNPKKYFIYCDTDSVHALLPYEDCDDKELGKMKCEGIYEYGKYLAPKTYLLYNNIEEKETEFEIHTKGVNTNIVKKEIEKCKNIKEVDNLFSSGKTFKCLTSLNVKGGKALIYIDKVLLNEKLDRTLKDDEILEGMLK